MAEKLVKYYKYIADVKGLQGKSELAKKTMIPSILAGTTPDTPENMKLFTDAIEKITGKPAPSVDTI